MNTRNTPNAEPEIRNSPLPGQILPADLASPEGKRLEPLHPDDVEIGHEPFADEKARTRNPLADSPDDGE